MSSMDDDESNLLEELEVDEPKRTQKGVKKKITEKRSPWNVKVIESQPIRIIQSSSLSNSSSAPVTTIPKIIQSTTLAANSPIIIQSHSISNISSIPVLRPQTIIKKPVNTVEEIQKGFKDSIVTNVQEESEFLAITVEEKLQSSDDESNSDYEAVLVDPTESHNDPTDKNEPVTLDDDSSDSDYEEVLVEVPKVDDKINKVTEKLTDVEINPQKSPESDKNEVRSEPQAVETSSASEEVQKSLENVERIRDENNSKINRENESDESGSDSESSQSNSENSKNFGDGPKSSTLETQNASKDSLDPGKNSENLPSADSPPKSPLDPSKSTQDHHKEKSPFDFSDLSSDDGLEDAFEFTPLAIEKDNLKLNLNPKFHFKKTFEGKHRKVPEELIEELKNDPKRLAGGLKKGLYDLPMFSGVPFCKFCETFFHKAKEVREHKKVCQYLQCEPEFFICRICGQKRRQKSFANHNHHTKCAYCDKRMINPTNSRDVAQHINKRHPGLPFKRAVLIDPDGYMNNLLQKMKEQGINYEERIEKIAMREKKQQINSKTISCETCGENFTNEYHYGLHVRIHKNSQQFPCEHCGKIYFHTSNLRRHQSVYHPDKFVSLRPDRALWGSKKSGKASNRQKSSTEMPLNHPNDSNSHYEASQTQPNDENSQISFADQNSMSQSFDESQNGSQKEFLGSSEVQKLNEVKKSAESVDELDQIVAALVEEKNLNEKSPRIPQKTQEMNFWDENQKSSRRGKKRKNSESSEDFLTLISPKKSNLTLRKSARARKPTKKFENSLMSSRDSSPSNPASPQGFGSSSDDDYNPDEDFEEIEDENEKIEGMSEVMEDTERVIDTRNIMEDTEEVKNSSERVMEGIEVFGFNEKAGEVLRDVKDVNEALKGFKEVKIVLNRIKEPFNDITKAPSRVNKVTKTHSMTRKTTKSLGRVTEVTPQIKTEKIPENDSQFDFIDVNLFCEMPEIKSEPDYVHENSNRRSSTIDGHSSPEKTKNNQKISSVVVKSEENSSNYFNEASNDFYDDSSDSDYFNDGQGDFENFNEGQDGSKDGQNSSKISHNSSIGQNTSKVNQSASNVTQNSPMDLPITLKTEQGKITTQTFNPRSHLEVRRAPVTKNFTLNSTTLQRQPDSILGGIPFSHYKVRNCAGIPYCKFCDKIFKTRKDRSDHIKICEFLQCDEEYYICRICKELKKKKSFSAHVHYAVECQYCGKKITHFKELRAHIARNHAGEGYKAPLGFSEEFIQNYLKQKMEEESEVLKYREEILRKRAEREKNRVPKNSNQFYVCDICGFEDDFKQPMLHHLLRHRNALRRLNCYTCGIKFKTEEEVSEHKLKVHPIEKILFQCNFCGKDFQTRESVRTHQRLIHGFQLKCEVCRVEVTKHELNNHMKEFHGTLTCQHCGKLFLIPSRLKYHERRHTVNYRFKGGKPGISGKIGKIWNCQFCPEFFDTQQNLNIHLRFHDAAEKFPCDICGKSFLAISALNSHQRKKHEIGMKCEICKEKVKDKKDLKEHMKTHGEFVCEICGKDFVGPRKLKFHMRYHMKDKIKEQQIKCDFCRRTVIPNRMRNHVFKFHKEEYDEWAASAPELVASAMNC